MQQTVLIIDDNENDVFIAKRILSKIYPELRTESALSGEAGLKFLRGGTGLPALVLLDLKMTGMSGVDTLRQIRADTLLRNIPVVIVTSSSIEADMTAANAAGANSIVYKSVDTEQFIGDLKLVLERWLEV